MPSTTIIAQPSVMMPAYNPIKYIIDNADKNEPGFRYIFTIYPATGSHIPANVVAQYKSLPVYGTGYGEQDISRLMQSLVTWNFAAGQVNESWYLYDIDLGFEYIDNINYGTSLADNGGNVQITFTAHGFVQGDQISITQDDLGVANPGVEGLHTVLSATANNFTINALYADVTDVTINGEVTYADLRKTIVLDDEVIETMEVFNGAYSLGIYAQGAFPYIDYYGILDPSYALTSLTNPNTSSTAASITDNIFYLMCRVVSGVEYILTYFNMDNTQIGQDSPYNPANGLYNFPIDTATYSITEDFYIRIKAYDVAGTEFKYYFNYDNRCAINEDVLYYLDRMGSWQSFNFQLKTYEKGQISREMYNQHVDGQVTDGQWVYSSDAMGSKTYNINVSNTLDLNTNWMDQYNANRFQELLTSSQVFYFNGTDYRACTIEATSFENFRQRNKNLIKQSVTIKLALNTPING
jgi:hypothetical protein